MKNQDSKDSEKEDKVLSLGLWDEEQLEDLFTDIKESSESFSTGVFMSDGIFSGLFGSIKVKGPKPLTDKEKKKFQPSRIPPLKHQNHKHCHTRNKIPERLSNKKLRKKFKGNVTKELKSNNHKG